MIYPSAPASPPANTPATGSDTTCIPHRFASCQLWDLAHDASEPASIRLAAALAYIERSDNAARR